MSHNIHWKTLQELAVRGKSSSASGPLQPKTENQRLYLNSIREKVITICLGPAGTGKTYLPACLGVEWLLAGKIEKIVLTRPLVTCSVGNRDALGILPGDLMEKVGPYMRPLLDVLEKKVGKDEIQKLVYQKKIDVIPLDVMRGLSLDKALIIADEMQNSSMDQIRCLATRFALGSKLIISGDPTQSDLPAEIPPLVHAYHLLANNKDIGRVLMGKEDVVRHPLISFIDDKLSGNGRSFIIAPNCESYFKEYCTHCGTINWVDFGDESDPENPEVEAMVCWLCKKTSGMNAHGDFVKACPELCGLKVMGARRPPIG